MARYTLSNRRLCAAICLAAVLFAPAAWAADDAASKLHADYQRLRAKFDEAPAGWRPEQPASGSLLFIASDHYTPAFDDGAPLSEDRRKYADALFDLAKKAADAGQLSLAFQWATEAVRENPNHSEARRVLGYEQLDGQWLTSYGVRMAEAGNIWHPYFGWVAAEAIPRYEAGERLVGSRWMSAEADSARRTQMKNGWQVRTDHFLVTTNHSLDAAAELAARLERLHQIWRQLFAGFYLSENEVRRLFAGEREPRRQIRPFRVYYHRDHEEYADALRRRQPRIAETLGIYFDADSEAHFFAGEEQDAGTLYHEAVHQLFQESRPAARQIGRDGNFWIIEGVATYFETLTEHADPVAGLYFTVGESDAGRLPAARSRLQDGFYIPLDELVRMGKTDVQQHPEIAKLYSQSAGLAAFLMDAQDGRYREPLVRYLKEVYVDRDSEQSLRHATGGSYDELDAEYRRYIESLP
ncbi:MAG TPA: hypothetical protein VGK58_17575 [Lacipirellulaceae bacterium]